MAPGCSTLPRLESISPPPKRRRMANDRSETLQLDERSKQVQRREYRNRREDRCAPLQHPTASNPQIVASPVQLNSIEQLPPASNDDTISLGGILGDIMIKECWLFNYLFDLDFIMGQLDPDVRAIIKVHVVHGSWRKEDVNRLSLYKVAKLYPNVDVVTAYMPEAFGTHHSKMIILFRHDDLSQVIILTGNFIQRDWSMSQAVWRSPLLPLLHKEHPLYSPTAASPGSGLRFKHDLMAYLNTYGSKLKNLTADLGKYDFRTIKAALVASVPGKQNLRSIDPNTETLWGWPGLKHVLSSIRSRASQVESSEEKMAMKKSSPGTDPHIVIQVSSVASVGEKWLFTVLFPALATMGEYSQGGCHDSNVKRAKPRYSIVFPTADTIRKSVNGYDVGASIHMKTQTPTQAKQLSDIRPMLCHWAKTAASSIASVKAHVSTVGRTGRERAAPHVKTYIRFADASMQHIDWAMVTSANLSTQAWGSAVSVSGEVRICSYEIGVIFWPALWDNGPACASQAEMVPVFRSDIPSSRQSEPDEKPRESRCISLSGRETPEADEDGDDRSEEWTKGGTRVGWRMPYDLPLVPYGAEDMPWCATEPCNQRDCMGRIWPGYAQ